MCFCFCELVCKWSDMSDPPTQSSKLLRERLQGRTCDKPLGPTIVRLHPWLTAVEHPESGLKQVCATRSCCTWHGAAYEPALANSSHQRRSKYKRELLPAMAVGWFTADLSLLLITSQLCTATPGLQLLYTPQHAARSLACAPDLRGC